MNKFKSVSKNAVHQRLLFMNRGILSNVINLNLI
jgi:hypothetical protein